MLWLVLAFLIPFSVQVAAIFWTIGRDRKRAEIRKLSFASDYDTSPGGMPDSAAASALSRQAQALPGTAPKRTVRTQAEAQRDATIGLLLHDEDDFRQALVLQARRRARPAPPRAPFVPSTSNPPETTSTVRISIFCLNVPPGDRS